MKRFKFKKIDAFTDGSSSGNPAGCVFLNDKNEITDDEMQQIARELKGFVSEVIYIAPDTESSNSYLLRYYSSECEVDFCGHGTIATMYDFIKSNPQLLAIDEVMIKVKNENLIVQNDINNTDSVYIQAPAPGYLETDIKAEDLARALKINKTSLDNSYSIELINGGLNTLIVPIKGLEECLAIFPDQLELKDFCLNNNIDIILVFARDVYLENSDYRTRVFAPKFGYLEDPATGSGNSAFAYYLLKNKNWDGHNLTVEQSADRENPNIIKLSSSVQDGIRRVKFGGSAVVRIEGDYLLH